MGKFTELACLPCIYFADVTITIINKFTYSPEDTMDHKPIQHSGQGPRADVEPMAVFPLGVASGQYLYVPGMLSQGL
jgi:hypothetical protein